MNKQEYINTGKALAKIPGAENCPWELVLDKDQDILFVGMAGKNDGCFQPQGKWFCIDDFSPMSAAKFLERAGVGIANHIGGDYAHGVFFYLGAKLPRNPFFVIRLEGKIPTELDYNKVILAIGQNARDETKTEEERRPWMEAWERGMKVEE